MKYCGQIATKDHRSKRELKRWGESQRVRLAPSEQIQILGPNEAIRADRADSHLVIDILCIEKCDKLFCPSHCPILKVVGPWLGDHP